MTSHSSTDLHSLSDEFDLTPGDFTFGLKLANELSIFLKKIKGLNKQQIAKVRLMMHFLEEDDLQFYLDDEDFSYDFKQNSVDYQIT